MAHNPDAQRVHLTQNTVQGLLSFHGDQQLGRDQGHAFNRLVNFLKAADAEEREFQAQRHPEVVAGVLFIIRVPSAIEMLQTMAKRYEAGLEAEASDQLLSLADLLERL